MNVEAIFGRLEMCSSQTTCLLLDQIWEEYVLKCIQENPNCLWSVKTLPYHHQHEEICTKNYFMVFIWRLFICISSTLWKFSMYFHWL